MEVYEFDRATAVSAQGNGRWLGEIHDGWDIGGNANGGYVLAIAGRAMREAAGRRDPITITAHYLAPFRPGPVDIDITVVKSGRMFTTVSASLRQGDRVGLQVLGAFGDAAEDDMEVNHGAPPELLPIDQCIPRPANNGTVPVALMQRLRVAVDPAVISDPDEPPNGTGIVEGYFEFVDDRPIDTLALLLACDSFMPAVHTLDIPRGWVPTVELTTHVRGVPAPGPLRCRYATRFVRGGYFEEDGELWDSEGHLVALSRQLALVARV